MRVPFRSYWGPVYERWDALHVERHGKYSVERMYRFRLYSERTSLLRAAVVLVLTPLPCLTIVTLMDTIPLEPPERGIEHSQLFWLRLLFVSWLILFAVLKQCRQFIVRLPMGISEILLASLFVAAGSTAFAYCMSARIGFPLPFTIGVESPGALVLLVVAMMLLWGRLVKGNPALQRELFHYVLVVMTQLSFTYIYPAYTFVFRKLAPVPQVAFALLLPMMKIVAKNWMSYLLQHLEDLKPEFIIFNVEVFHALFVATCMQAAASFHTTLLLLGTDFLFGTLSLRRILKRIRTFYASVHFPLDSDLMSEDAEKVDAERAVQWKKMHFLEAAIYLVETNPNLLTHESITIQSQATTPKFSQILPSPHTAKSRSATSSDSSPVTLSEDAAREQTQTQQAPTLPDLPKSACPPLHLLQSVRAKLGKDALTGELPEEEKRLVSALTEVDRVRFVQHILGVLFWAEFILLIEFTEVIIPIVYCTSTAYQHPAATQADDSTTNSSNIA